MQIDVALARRVLEVVDAGLVNGMGLPEPGKMCVEAAICYALGLPHGDNPECVHPAVRAYKIRLNDSGWSSPMARSTGMRRVAVAQLGSESIDGRKFSRIVVEQTIRRIVPMALRAAAGRPGNAPFRDRLLAAAERCAENGDRGAADAARVIARDAYAAAYADAAAYAAAYAAAAAAAAAAADADADKILIEGAEICLQALRECGSPGVALLDQIEAEAA